MKRLIAALLTLMLLMSCAMASDNAALEQEYSDCIIRLNDYLLNAKDVEIDLNQLESDFKALGNYDNGNAALFALYTQVLVALRDVRYAECKAPLFMLNANAEKIVMVMVTYPDLYALGDIPTLQKYCDARMCEVQGDYARAFELYSSITGFYDSMSRATDCFELSTVTEAAAATETAAVQTPAPADVQTDTITLTAYTGTRAVNLSWAATSGLKNFKVYRRCDSRNTNWEQITNTEDKEYKDFQIVKELYYTYYVEGVNAQGQTIRSNELQMFTKTKSGSSNTNKNANTNTNTNQNSNSSTNQNNNTSENTNNNSSSASNSNTNVNSNSQNITIIIPESNPVPQWSEWSEWSTTPVYASATREVESMTVTEVETHYEWNYSRYRYIGKNGNNWYYPEYYRGSNYVRDGEWQYKTVEEPLAVVGTAAGETLYEGNWYHESMSEWDEEIAQWIEYRYRDRIN